MKDVDLVTPEFCDPQDLAKTILKLIEYCKQLQDKTNQLQQRLTPVMTKLDVKERAILVIQRECPAAKQVEECNSTIQEVTDKIDTLLENLLRV